MTGGDPDPPLRQVICHPGETVEILKVSATSRPVSVAGAVAGVIRTAGRVEVQAIGAGAVNQAVKAIAISRGYVAPGGIELCCVPSFVEIQIDGEVRTGIRLVVEVRHARDGQGVP